MAKTKISEFSATAANNTDIDSINIAEGCAPSGINDAIRELMAQLKDFQTGAVGDSFNGPVGTTTAAAGAFTTLSATGVTTVQAGTSSAPAITTSGDTNTGIFFPAADTIAFTEGGTEAMRIDSSGNVGVGTSSPAKRLSVVNATDATTVGTNAVMSIQAGSSVNSVAEIGFSYGSWGGTNPIASLGYQITSNAGVGAGALTFSTRSVTTDTAPTERMRIDSSGNLGIGTSSPERRLDVNQASAAGEIGAFVRNSAASTAGNASSLWFGTWSGASTTNIYNAKISALNTDAGSAASALTFWTYNGSGSSGGVTERARIDSSGNLLVGTTSQNFSGLNQARFCVNTPNDNHNAVSAKVNGTAQICYLGGSSINDYYWGYMLNAANSSVGNINVTSTATAYNTSSDYRLKNTIAPMTGALAKVVALKPCTYKWNADGSDGEGFIAHELAEVCPQAVTGEKDAVNEDGSIKPQSIDTSFLVATLTAAIQEQQAIITALIARVEALESN